MPEDPRCRRRLLRDGLGKLGEISEHCPGHRVIGVSDPRDPSGEDRDRMLLQDPRRRGAALDAVGVPIDRVSAANEQPAHPPDLDRGQLAPAFAEQSEHVDPPL